MASHSLLQRRFAPRKVVRLLPDKRGRLFYVSHLVIFYLTYIKNMNSFILSRQLPPFSGEVPSLRGDRGMLAYTGQNI